MHAALSADALVKHAKLHTRARVDHTSSNVDGASLFVTLHPLASFTPDQVRLGVIPDNVKFEPRDSLQLCLAMTQVVARAGEHDAVKSRSQSLALLEPARFFTQQLHFISKPEAVAYERAVKQELIEWLRHGLREPAVLVLKALGNRLLGVPGEDEKRAAAGEASEESEDDLFGGEGAGDCDQDEVESAKTQARGKGNSGGGDKAMMQRLFKLCGTLHRQDRLPAVIFNFDRATCEKLAFGFSDILAQAEEQQRQEHAKDLKLSEKQRDQKAKIEKRARDKVLSEKKEEQLAQELAEMGGDTVEVTSLDEMTFKSQFTFVQDGRSTAQDFDRITESARKAMGENHPMVQILRRGIGVHHSGLQNKYRMAVEMLFRCGYLRIVFSTETLAFGINMPCRSVVFAGDHVALNSIQYQQMSGRAGRRGLDVLGHVIFFDVPEHKLHRLIVAPVPTLRGQFGLTPSLVLRLVTFLKHLPKTKGAKKDLVEACRCSVMHTLQKPLCHLAHPALAPVLPAHARYTAEMLMAANLIDASGEPSPLATLAEHLHTADPSNLAFIALLQSGALHQLCQVSE